MQLFSYTGWRTRSERRKTKEKLRSSVTYFTLTQTHPDTPSWNCNRPPFSHSIFISQTCPITSWLSPLSFVHRPPPLTLQSQEFGWQWDQATVRCMSVKKKWMANSIKSIIPKAAPCYRWHSKGVLMHCLRAQPPPLPHYHRSLSCCGPLKVGVGMGRVGGGSDSQSYQRPERARFSCTQKH